MTNRPRTAQIKQSTREALMQQFALAANEIVWQRTLVSILEMKLERAILRPWHLAWWRK